MEENELLQQHETFETFFKVFCMQIAVCINT